MPSIQLSIAVRNAALQAYETAVGTSPKLRLYTGPQPANCAAAATGTMIVEMALPADWLGTPANGTIEKLGTWSGTAVAAGIAGHYRIVNTAGSTCHEQGSVSQAITLLATAATGVNGNVLTFADTTGIAFGQGVVGAGIPAGATVLSTTGTTVTISAGIPGGFPSTTPATFGDTSGNLQLNNSNIGLGQGVVIDVKALTCPGN